MTRESGVPQAVPRLPLRPRQGFTDLARPLSYRGAARRAPGGSAATQLFRPLQDSRLVRWTSDDHPGTTKLPLDVVAYLTGPYRTLSWRGRPDRTPSWDPGVRRLPPPSTTASLLLRVTVGASLKSHFRSWPKQPTLSVIYLAADLVDPRGPMTNPGGLHVSIGPSRPRRCLVIGVILAGLSFALVPVAPARASTGPESDLLGRLNAVRAGSGLAPLDLVGDLEAAAREQSQRNAAAGQLAHNPSLLTDVMNWGSIGENVGFGRSVDQIHDALVASPPHRANMLNGSYTQVGIGVVVSGGSIWVTQVFRRPLGSFPVYGAIGDTWPSLRGILADPVTAEYGVPGGRAQGFMGGAMYWSPSTGAREVHGAIMGRYERLGGAFSPLGLPATDELAAADGNGRMSHFQRGSVYWSPASDAHFVWGAIRDSWAGKGWERGTLGYPVTDELVAPDNAGRLQHFQGGSVYWTGWTGAREVRGAIRAAWASSGWELGWLGYPVSDEYDDTGGRRSDFERGSLIWNASSGQVTVP